MHRRTFAIAVVAGLGWGLDAWATGSSAQPARQAPTDQVSVLKVEGMT